MVVLQEDIGSAFEISSVSYVFSYSEGGTIYVKDFTLSLAHVENDQLTEIFSANYQPGSLVEVCHIDSLYLENGYGNELVLELDTPFQYNGQDNLLVDIYYPEGNCYSNVYNWEAGSNRSLVDLFMPGGSGSNSGYLGNWLPYMVLGGTQSLDQCTFGAIKIELGTLQE